MSKIFFDLSRFSRLISPETMSIFIFLLSLRENKAEEITKLIKQRRDNSEHARMISSDLILGEQRS
jgi:hypothetical protein